MRECPEETGIYHPKLRIQHGRLGLTVFCRIQDNPFLNMPCVGLVPGEVAEAAQGPGGPDPAKMVEVMTRYGLVLARPKAPAGP